MHTQIHTDYCRMMTLNIHQAVQNSSRARANKLVEPLLPFSALQSSNQIAACLACTTLLSVIGGVNLELETGARKSTTGVRLVATGCGRCGLDDVVVVSSAYLAR